MSPRLELDYTHASAFDEAELVNVFRDSSANDRTMLFGLLDRWAGMTSAQRGALYRIADLFVSANSWRRGEAKQS